MKLDRNARELLDVVSDALATMRADTLDAAAHHVLGALSDHVFDGATSEEVRADLKTLRAEGLDGPVTLFAGLLAFGGRDRAGPAARRAARMDDAEYDDAEDDAEDDDAEHLAEDDDDEGEGDDGSPYRPRVIVE
jgi:hypothetical protein